LSSSLEGAAMQIAVADVAVAIQLAGEGLEEGATQS
jgi:hypothetical protein